MKTALVTGSAGFVGRHMVPALEARGYDVIGVDLRNAGTFEDSWTHNALRVFQTWTDRFDLVVHLAAHVGGRAQIDGDPLAVAQNVTLDAEFFRWAARTQQPRVVYYSSSAVYPVYRQNDIFEGQTLREEHRSFFDLDGVPDKTYGWAKLTGEYLAQFATQAGVKVHIFRPFSGYGEDQDLDYPFPMFAKRALAQANEENPTFEIWGSQWQTRDWIHIDDVVEGTLRAVEKDITGPVNLCSGVATSMGNLAYAMCRHLGYRPTLRVDTSKPMGVLHRIGDPTKMHQFYTPKVFLEEGIRRALEALQ